MIFGNPSKFAIQTDWVQEWSHQGLNMGVFNVYLNWHRLSASTVSSEVLSLQTKQFSDSFKKFSKPIELTNDLRDKDSFDLLCSLVDLTYPQNADLDLDNCWDYVISPDALHDKGFFLFRYANGDQETILGGSIKSKFAVSTTNTMGYASQIVFEADDYCAKLTPSSM